jgi:hypothetical protein
MRPFRWLSRKFAVKRSSSFLFGIALVVPAILTASVDGALAQSPADASGADAAQVAAPAIRHHGELLLRSWQDEVKIDGSDHLRRVEIVYDYGLGKARRRVYDAQDLLISDEVLAEQPRPNPAEIEEAFNTVRRDPELGRLARSLNAQFDGGFLVREPEGKPCGPPTRCVQVHMLSESRRKMHHRSAVDLSHGRGRIAHRDYEPTATD